MPTISLDPDALRKHFHALTAKRAKIDEKLEPLRAELDELVAGKDAKMTVAQARKREDEIRPQIVKLQQQLYPIEQERAIVARALGGQTGEPE